VAFFSGVSHHCDQVCGIQGLFMIVFESHSLDIDDINNGSDTAESTGK
jgi:hypothetical protein